MPTPVNQTPQSRSGDQELGIQSQTTLYTNGAVKYLTWQKVYVLTTGFISCPGDLRQSRV
jgi:hypothetical protein